MWNYIKKLRNFIGNIVLILSILSILVSIILWIRKPSVPEQTILELNLEQEFVEHIPEDPVAQALHYDKANLRDTVQALERAAQDPRVLALVARVGAVKMGQATVQELRDAILALRSEGKKAIAYADTFGEFAAGNKAYYLATAFDEIYLQPSGFIGLTGLLTETPFVRGSLDKLKIKPRLDHRAEYKNFKNLFTDYGFTEAHREANRTIVDSLFRQIISGIAKGRELPETRVRELFDSGPLFGQEALREKLVDGLAYRDEIYAKVKQEFGEKAKPLYLETYLERAGSPYEEGKTIALIYGTGIVKRGESSFNPLFQAGTMGSKTVTAALRKAAKDSEVRAILFRINSPGGSYVASDSIWREVLKAREAGKPVIVSMGDVAGSGGYFVAMEADKIVAHPGTITGSIGVLSGKMLTAELWERLGVNWDSVSTSANATMWTGLHDYTENGWDRFQTGLDRIYEDFTTKVAQGRNLSQDQVLEIAKGRVWSGEDGKKLGLVDELGGFPVALRLARQEAGLAKDAPVQLKLFPETKSQIEQLIEEDPESSEDKVALMALHRLLKVAEPAVQVLNSLFLPNQPLLVPPLGQQK